MWGLTGYDVEESRNMRVVVDDPSFSGNNATFTYGTCIISY